ncbi:MAG TPA: aminodeoxychorismate/anthranilate synthase component II [Candidatus Baltobacteraceae bacterium]|nr:aminodeoxychorismate/anthranilate synthase component II [Candidatus Baltobacteraceae bacterium]
MKVLFVDNFDSFTYNVVHLLASQGIEPHVLLNDDPALTPALLESYDALVVGPGPGNPGQTPGVVDLIRAAAQRRTPVFGVCFGLQAIGQAFGARVVHAPAPMHGKTSKMTHEGRGVFEGLDRPITATRYHSLCLDEATLPPELRVDARSEDGVVQAVSHRTLPIAGVQFHPESVLSECGDRIVRNALRLDSRSGSMVESLQ